MSQVTSSFRNPVVALVDTTVRLVNSTMLQFKMHSLNSLMALISANVLLRWLLS